MQQVQELSYLNYGKFNLIESFQQKVSLVTQQILEYTSSKSDAFYTVISALTLLAIGRANYTAKAHIEDGINSQKFDSSEAILEYSFQRLISYRRLNSNSNNSNNNNNSGINSVKKDLCSYCQKTHGPICFIQYPDKAPQQYQARYKKLSKEHEDKKKASSPNSELSVGFVSSINSNN